MDIVKTLKTISILANVDIVSYSVIKKAVNMSGYIASTIIVKHRYIIDFKNVNTKRTTTPT